MSLILVAHLLNDTFFQDSEKFAGKFYGGIFGAAAGVLALFLIIGIIIIVILIYYVFATKSVYFTKNSAAETNLQLS